MITVATWTDTRTTEPQGSGAEIVVDTPSELLNALNSATGGEVILLERGNYGDIDLNGLEFSSHVTIRSADGNHDAVFHTLDIVNSSYIRVDGVHVDNSGDGTVGAGFVNIVDSDHIEIRNSEINGSVDGSYYTHPSRFISAYGLEVSGNSTNIVISNNYIHNAEHGAVFLGVEGLEVTDNTINHVASDSFKFAGIRGALIENNAGASIVHPSSDDHLDFIQFQGSSSDVILRGNTLLIEDTDNQVYQGIFIKDGDYDNFIIEDNLVYTNTVNAIYVSSGHNVAGGTGGNFTIRNNTVLSPPDLTKWGSADISIVSLEGAYTVENNIVDRIVDRVNDGNVSGNLVLQWENPAGENYYNDVYVNATAGGGASIQDFAPVPSSQGESMGAFRRIGELLGSEPGEAPADANKAPAAVDDVLILDWGTTATIDVLENDSDPDKDSLSVTGFTQGANGKVSDRSDGKLAYMADAGFSGTDSFTYTVSDGALSAAATVKVTVNPAEEPGVPSPEPVFAEGEHVFSGSTGGAVILPHNADYEMAAGTLKLTFTPSKVTAKQQGLFSKDSAYYDNGGHLGVLMVGNDLLIRLQGTKSEAKVKVPDLFTAGEEYHLSVAFGPEGLKVDLNGREIADNPWQGGLLGNAEPIVIGANQWSSDDGVANKLQDAFHGTISSAALYDAYLL